MIRTLKLLQTTQQVWRQVNYTKHTVSKDSSSKRGFLCFYPISSNDTDMQHRSIAKILPSFGYIPLNSCDGFSPSSSLRFSSPLPLLWSADDVTLTQASGHLTYLLPPETYTCPTVCIPRYLVYCLLCRSKGFISSCVFTPKARKKVQIFIKELKTGSQRSAWSLPVQQHHLQPTYRNNPNSTQRQIIKTWYRSIWGC